MDINGEHQIPAAREAVWRALNDADILRRSIPGCEELEKISATEFNARITAKIGPVKARFKARIQLEDLEPPASYTLTGEGQGGVAGFAKGAAKVRLLEEGEGASVLKYEAEMRVGGKIAQVGSRLVRGAARKTAAGFFANFVAILGESAYGKPVAAQSSAKREGEGGPQ